MAREKCGKIRIHTVVFSFFGVNWKRFNLVLGKKNNLATLFFVTQVITRLLGVQCNTEKRYVQFALCLRLCFSLRG